jgi:death-on-curing protein
LEYLTVAEVLLLHARLIQRTGGSGGVRDLTMLESAVARPRGRFDGVDLYADVWSKAAALMESLIRNHPFVDGNKRTGLAAVALFLELNGRLLTATNDEAADLVQRVAQGLTTVAEIAAWLRDHTGERPAEGV